MKIVLLSTLLIIITACSNFIPPEPKPVQIPSEFTESITNYNVAIETDWWKNFNDKELNELVEYALSYNYAYRMTLKDVKIAQSLSDQAEDVAEAKSEEAKLGLISEVADTYYQIAALNRIIPNVQRQTVIMHSLSKIAHTQYSIGYIDNSTLRDIKSKESTIKSDLDNLKKRQKVYTYSMAYLLGQYPEDFHVLIPPLHEQMQFNKLIPASIPEQVMQDRPDIRSAFLAIKLARSKEEYEKAQLNYENTVHNAFQEVDDALLSFKDDQEVLLTMQDIVRNARSDYKAAEIQYKSGQIDYAASLNYELSMLQAEYEFAKQNLLIHTDIIQIYRALGLGVNRDTPDGLT